MLGLIGMTELNREESYNYLRQQKLGRLVVQRKDDMDLFQVNYVVDGEDIYFRTAEGTKLFTIALGNRVLFEAEEIGTSSAWSVVIKGRAQKVERIEEIQYCDTLDLKPWLPTLKYNFVRITPEEVSGRYYEYGEEPERY